MRRKRLCIPLLLILTLLAAPSLRGEETPPDLPVLQLHYFYTPSCPLCEPANRVVRQAEARFGGRIQVTWRNQTEGVHVMSDYYAQLSARGMDEETPKLAVFFPQDSLYDQGILDHLHTKIEETLASAAAFNALQVEELTEAERLRQAQQRSSWAFVILGGLGDGVNPCAFATVILFVSMLTAIGRSRREILAVGISFIVAVFLAYFAMGLLLYQIRGMLSHFAIVSLVIDVVAFLFVILVGVLSLYDAAKALRTGGRGEMLLVLPESFKDKIRKRLRASAHSGSLIVGSFVTGIIISFLEAACTGQLYLPLINILVNSDEGFAEGMVKLFVYNIMFILPLIGVFLAVFFGASSEMVANAARKRVWLTKLLLGIIFLGMGTWLGFTVIPALHARFAPIPLHESGTPPKDAPAPDAHTAPAEDVEEPPVLPGDPDVDTTDTADDPEAVDAPDAPDAADTHDYVGEISIEDLDFGEGLEP